VGYFGKETGDQNGGGKRRRGARNYWELHLCRERTGEIKLLEGRTERWRRRLHIKKEGEEKG